MQPPESYVNERLDHLGVVAGVCQEIGLADVGMNQSDARQVGCQQLQMCYNSNCVW
jgi:hypothetical protein